jgi:hypothetical protein
MLATILLGLLLAGCQAFRIPPAPSALTAKSVCDDYGLTRGKVYDECVAYQESRAQLYPSQSIPPYRMDQYNNRVDAEGFRVDSIGRRTPVQNQYQPPLGLAPDNRR